MGTARTTFLVDSDGRIAKTWPKVKPEGHAADVLASLDAFQGGAGPGEGAEPDTKEASLVGGDERSSRKGTPGPDPMQGIRAGRRA